MARSRVVIEVTPSRLEVACVRGGETVAAKAVRHDAVAWADTWPGGLLTLDEPLRVLIDELGAAGLPATLVVGSPTSAYGVFSCGAAAGQAGAEAAAKLAIANMSGFDLSGNPCEVAVLSRDAEPGQQGRQSHSLAYAERDQIVSSLISWAERAGVRVEGVLPVEAVMLRAAVAQVLAVTADHSASVVLWVGEHASVLASGSASRLRFVRTIAVGAETLVDALTRPMSPRGGEPVTLTRAQARSLLWRSGIPGREEVIDASRGLDGTAALPLLQPVLQRLSVESKQSLRFGLSEEERAVAVVRLIGPGAQIRGLATALSMQSGLTMTAPDPAGAEPLSSERGVLCALEEHGAMLTGLMPRASVEGRERTRARRWLHAGVALAAALVAGDALMTRVELRREGERLAAASGLSRAAIDAQQALTAAYAEMESLEWRIAQASRTSPAWAPTLAMLADFAPESVRLSSLELSGELGPPSVRLSGFASAVEPAEATRAVKAYMEALESFPLLSGVRLENTERGVYEGRAEQRFEIKAEMVRATTSVTAQSTEPSL